MEGSLSISHVLLGIVGLILAFSLLLHTFIPQKHICLDKVTAQPVAPMDLKIMFDKCLDKCNDNNADCIRQCVVLADLMSERLFNVTQ